MNIVVLPFEALRGADAKSARSALELELELVTEVRVQDGGALLAELKAAKDMWAPITVKKAMARRGIEILVAAPAGFSPPILIAFGKDGEARIVQDLPRGATPDRVAATALAALRPQLSKWSRLKPVVLPKAARVTADDVIAESDRRRDPGREPGRDPDGDPGDERRSTIPSLDDDEDERAEKARRRAALDDAERDRLDGGERRSLLDVEDERAGGSGIVKPAHMLAVSGAFDGATWQYNFTPNAGPQPQPVVAGFYPGGSIRADLWPLPFLGIDAGGTLSTVQFVLNSSPELIITPGKFISYHIDAGVSGRGRYMLRVADEGPFQHIGFGVRAGYRIWNATVETQNGNNTQEDRLLTVVPGFTMHALAVGPEIFIPIFIGQNRLELELKLDTLPFTNYSEEPDNPGATALAFGYHAEVQLRYDIFGGFFVEAVGKSTGATIQFDGTGDRVTVDGARQFVALEGGRSLTYNLGFSIGVGFMY